jgi:hypothetical protein
MSRRIFLCFWAALVLGLLSACGSASQPAALATPAPTAAPPATHAALAPTAPATSAPAASDTPAGTTAEGYHTLGRADAPVTLVMYSDFL